MREYASTILRCKAPGSALVSSAGKRDTFGPRARSISARSASSGGVFVHVAREAHEIEQAIAVGVVFGLVLLGGLLRFDLSTSAAAIATLHLRRGGGGFRRARFSPLLLHVRRALDVLFRASKEKERRVISSHGYSPVAFGLSRSAFQTICASSASSFSESALTIRLSNVSLTASMHSSTSQSTGCSPRPPRGRFSRIGIQHAV